MSTSDIVEETLDGEPVAARVDLGGEDELVVTPTRTLVYRAEGLLSDESVEEFPHDAERVDVAESRRKAKVTLDYGLAGERTFALPSDRLESALHPVLAGVFNAAGITDSGETVKRTFRFSELTLVVTSARVVKHIGTAVWDDDHEEFHYDDVTDLAFERGTVATSVVITLGDRQERVKAPNDAARRVRESLEAALTEYYDVGSLEEFRTTVAPDDEGGANDVRDDSAGVAFGDGPDPLSADPAELAEEPSNGTRDASDSPASDAAEPAGVAASADDGVGVEREAESGAASVVESLERPDDDGFEGSGFESAAELNEADVLAELVDLRAAVEAQNERLDRQHVLIEQLVDEIRHGR